MLVKDAVLHILFNVVLKLTVEVLPSSCGNVRIDISENSELTGKTDGVLRTLD